MRTSVASSPGAPAPPARPASGRAPEVQDALNRYFYHPLAFRLARLLRPTGIAPNAVSVASGGLVCLAAVFYTRVGWPVGALAGFACHLLWHVVDGADGDLARMTGKASPIGEFVDGAADYLGHIVMYVLLAGMLDATAIGGWAWPLATVAGLSRIAQANHQETKRRQYLWRVYGTPWLGTQRGAGKPVFGGHGWASRLLASVVRAYLALGEGMAPYSARLDRIVADAAGDERRLAEVRLRIREASRGSLLLQKALAANPRTILLGLCMMAGTSLWYFVIEAVALNVLLLASIAYHNRVEHRLVAALSQR